MAQYAAKDFAADERRAATASSDKAPPIRCEVCEQRPVDSAAPVVQCGPVGRRLRGGRLVTWFLGCWECR